MNIRYGKSFHYLRQFVKRITSLLYPLIVRIWPLPEVKSIEETIAHIIEHKSSIARFGDSEILYIVDKLNLPYQRYDKRLAKKLKKVLKFEDNNILVGLPTAYRSFGKTDRKHVIFWRSQITWTYPRFKKYLDTSKEYFNANITRFYYGFGDLKASRQYFEMMKSIWNGRKILLIEGEKSRLGVGNDLFVGSVSIERILGPAHNSFDKFDDLYNKAIKHNTEKLVLIALGPTAKALAYDLAQFGFQAIDIGNLDIEYEWYRMGVKERVIVKGKYTSEVAGGRIVDDIENEEYENQIVARLV